MTVEVCSAPPITWPFHGRPHIEVGEYRYAAEVDPFPGYPHDRDLVKEIADRCDKTFPLKHDVMVIVGDHEGVERTNGWCFADSHGSGDDETWTHVIYLSGKRLPPHPAVTRYVVAHEYGHAAMYELARARGLYDTDEITAEYANMRGIDVRPSARGGTWHAAPAEIAACDFRITQIGVELEYWPHPDDPHPILHGEPPGLAVRVSEWWESALSEISDAFGEDSGDVQEVSV